MAKNWRGCCYIIAVSGCPCIPWWLAFKLVPSFSNASWFSKNVSSHGLYIRWACQLIWFIYQETLWYQDWKIHSRTYCNVTNRSLYMMLNYFKVCFISFSHGPKRQTPSSVSVFLWWGQKWIDPQKKHIIYKSSWRLSLLSAYKTHYSFQRCSCYITYFSPSNCQ